VFKDNQQKFNEKFKELQLDINRTNKVIKALEENGKTILKQKLEIRDKINDDKLEKVDSELKN